LGKRLLQKGMFAIWNPQLAMLHEKELTRGNRNRATLAIARKLVIYMLAVDRRGNPFIISKAIFYVCRVF
jgi:hypothetical protein